MKKKEDSPFKIVISGCCGRMGSLLVRQALRDKYFDLVGVMEHPGHPQIGQSLDAAPRLKITSDLKSLLQHADLLIDFTTPEASVANAAIAASANVPVIIGTTGFTNEHIEELRTLSEKIPIFWSANMSLGIFIIRKTIGSIFEILKRYGLHESSLVRISETHHVKKKDKPSGTAKQLLEDVMKASGQPAHKIPIESKREGDVVGVHRIDIDVGFERITLEHEATDRVIFALGALLVAKYFGLLLLEIGFKPGFYSMDDLMKLSVMAHS